MNCQKYARHGNGGYNIFRYFNRPEKNFASFVFIDKDKSGPIQYIDEILITRKSKEIKAPNILNEKEGEQRRSNIFGFINWSIHLLISQGKLDS